MDGIDILHNRRMNIFLTLIQAEKENNHNRVKRLIKILDKLDKKIDKIKLCIN